MPYCNHLSIKSGFWPIPSQGLKTVLFEDMIQTKQCVIYPPIGLATSLWDSFSLSNKLFCPVASGYTYQERNCSTFSLKLIWVGLSFNVGSLKKPMLLSTYYCRSWNISSEGSGVCHVSLNWHGGRLTSLRCLLASVSRNICCYQFENVSKDLCMESDCFSF